VKWHRRYIQSWKAHGQCSVAALCSALSRSVTSNSTLFSLAPSQSVKWHHRYIQSWRVHGANGQWLILSSSTIVQDARTRARGRARTNYRTGSRFRSSCEYEIVSFRKSMQCVQAQHTTFTSRSPRSLVSTSIPARSPLAGQRIRRLKLSLLFRANTSRRRTRSFRSLISTWARARRLTR
jgi:hypothetical protein